jgi:hypothetical protein
MLPIEIIYEIFYFLDIDTRLKNKIPPNKINCDFFYQKPKLIDYNHYIIQELNNILIITDLKLLDTIVIVKYKEMYTYTSKFVYLSTIITNTQYTLPQFI